MTMEHDEVIGVTDDPLLKDASRYKRLGEVVVYHYYKEKHRLLLCKPYLGSCKCSSTPTKSEATFEKDFMILIRFLV